MAFMWKKLLGLGAVGIGVATVIAVVNDDDVQATVVRVIDGDTFTAQVDDEEKRIRLLNVDTPELSRDGQQAECLAQEATDYLASVLTPGTSVDLHYDDEKTDRYDRDLAGVFIDGQLINADIARNGFGVAVVVGKNERFYPEVQQAQQEASAHRIGVHDPTLECSLAAQVDTTVAESLAVVAAGVAATDIVDLNLRSGKVISLLRDARHLRKLVDNPTPFEQAADLNFQQEKKNLEKAITDLERDKDSTENLKESFLKETEEKKLRKIEDKKRQRERDERADEDVETRKISPAVPHRLPTTSPTPAPAPAPAPGYDGYTGCRAYGGNYALTSTDNKGRSYAKIDCTTKVQIG